MMIKDGSTNPNVATAEPKIPAWDEPTKVARFTEIGPGVDSATAIKFIILIIVSMIQNLMKFAGVQAALNGIKPVVIGLILATSATMFLSTILGITTIGGGVEFHPWALLILAVLVGVSMAYQKWKGNKISPILLILLSAVLGMLIY